MLEKKEILANRRGINVYDFDGTIYKGDSSIDFYLFCLKKNKGVLVKLPGVIWAGIRYVLGIIEKTAFKAKFFEFLKKIDNVDELVEEFWQKKTRKIESWYLEQKKESDVIISASPEFLLMPLEKKLGIKVVASLVDKKTGKFLAENCWGEEKVRRFKEEIGGSKIKNFYSDSMADRPMMDLADNAYYVKRGILYDLNNDRDGRIARYLKVDRAIYFGAVLFLVVPIFIQLFFWFNRWVGIPCMVLLAVATWLVLKKYKPLSPDDYKKIFNKKKLAFIAVLVVIINVMSGAGGVFPQNWDYHGRNAVLRDLITHSWPVKYDYSGEGLEYEKGVFEEGGVLNYYFAFWLPGAMVGKLTNFEIASLFMLLWQTIGVMLFFYLVFRLLKGVKYRYFWIFIAFGGLNVIGYVLVNLCLNGSLPASPIGVEHIDTSMGSFSMQTFITQLFWVFNASVPTWVAIMLFLQQKDFRTCGYFMALLIPYAPFSIIGMAYLVGCYVLFGENLNKGITWRRFKSLFTAENIMGCLAMAPVLLMFMMNGGGEKGFFLLDSWEKGVFGEDLFRYILYIVLEFLVYVVIVNKKNYKQLLMCFVFFAVAPAFYIGGPNLGTKSTVPLLIILYLLVCKFLEEVRHNWKQRVLVIILLVAAMTNFNEFYRSAKYEIRNRENNWSNFLDSYYSFDDFEGEQVAPFIDDYVLENKKENKVLQWLLR